MIHSKLKEDSLTNSNFGNDYIHEITSYEKLSYTELLIKEGTVNNSKIIFLISQ